MTISALVPIKKHSTRLENKNFLDFEGVPLYQIILDKLSRMPEIDRILVNTDSEIIKENSIQKFPKVQLIDRPEYLMGDHITMNSLIAHDLEQCTGEHFLQTHCTNPLLTEKTIREAIALYYASLDRYDSLLSVDNLQKRGYFSNGKPINHSNDNLLPTQELDPVCMENSNLFLFSRTSFSNAGNSRVGLKPQLFPMSTLESIDIDYQEDFVLALLLHKHTDLFRSID